MIRRLVATLVGFGALAGCGEGGGGAPAATVRDSAGVTIVENVFPDSAEIVWWTLDATPLLDIGGAEAAEADALFQVGDALRLSDGRIVVTNGGSADVRYYAADGVHLRTTGRRGQGPGEFQRPRLLLPLAGDSVLVVDGRRASVLDPEGAFTRDFQVGGTGPSMGAIGRLAEGSIVATANLLDVDRLSDGFQRPDIAFVRHAADGTVLDTLVVVPGAESAIRTRGSQGRITEIQVSRPPFVKSTVYAAAGEVLVVGTQDAPQLEVYGANGALRLVIRTGAAMPPVTEEHLEGWYQRQRAAMPAELRAQFAERPEYADAGKVIPPYGAVELDDVGNIWILDYDDRIRPAGLWSVHDAEGRLVARVRMPESFRPLHIGEDFVLGVERDELDVEHVRMYRIRIEP